MTQEIGNLALIKVFGDTDGLIFIPSHDTLSTFQFSDFNYYTIYTAVTPRVPIEKRPHY